MTTDRERYHFNVEASAIRRFAESAWDQSELYRLGEDSGAVPVPPTFLGAAATMLGRKHPLLRLGFDVARAFHGSEIVTMYQPVFHGMRLEVEEAYEHAAWVEGRRAGRMKRALRRSTFLNEGGNCVARVVRVLLEASNSPAAGPAGPDLSLFHDGLAPRTDPSSAVPVSVEDLRPGDELRPCTFGPLTLTDFVRYAGASGDFTAIHFDSEAARVSGYPAPFAMGMLSAAFVGHMLTDWVVLVSPWSLNVRFHDLLWPGESLIVSGAVRSVSSDRTVLDIRCFSRGRLVTSAVAHIGWPGS